MCLFAFVLRSSESCPIQASRMVWEFYSRFYEPFKAWPRGSWPALPSAWGRRWWWPCTSCSPRLGHVGPAASRPREHRGAPLDRLPRSCPVPLPGQMDLKFIVLRNWSPLFLLYGCFFWWCCALYFFFFFKLQDGGT